jgi:hypothetical protein
LGPFFTFLKKDVYFWRILGYNSHVSQPQQNMKEIIGIAIGINIAIWGVVFIMHMQATAL